MVNLVVEAGARECEGIFHGQLSERCLRSIVFEFFQGSSQRSGQPFVVAQGGGKGKVYQVRIEPLHLRASLGRAWIYAVAYFTVSVGIVSLGRHCC